MYAYKVALIFIILICSYCFGDDEFFVKTKNQWQAAVSFNMNPHFEPGKPFQGPSDTTQWILDIFYVDTFFKLHKDCLYYYFPRNKGKGILKVVKIPINESCDESITKNSLISLKNIFNVGYELVKGKLVLKVDDRDYLYILNNYSNIDEFHLNSDSGKTSQYKGVLLSAYESDSGESLSEGDTCFDIDDECNTTFSNICEFCSTGVVEVKVNSCKRTYKKICSSKLCGEKGGYACIRGTKLFNTLSSYCFTDSPVGFCQKPFRVYCENGSLICR